MHVRGTGKLKEATSLFMVEFALLLKKKYQQSYIFVAYHSIKYSGNCDNGKKKSPNCKKPSATCKFTSSKKGNTF